MCVCVCVCVCICIYIYIYIYIRFFLHKRTFLEGVGDTINCCCCTFSRNSVMEDPFMSQNTVNISSVIDHLAWNLAFFLESLFRLYRRSFRFRLLVESTFVNIHRLKYISSYTAHILLKLSYDLHLLLSNQTFADRPMFKTRIMHDLARSYITSDKYFAINEFQTKHL